MRFSDKISSIMSQNINWFHWKKTTGYYLYTCIKSYVILIWRSRHFKRLPFQRKGVTFACQWLSSGQSSWKPVLSHLSSQTGNDPVYLRLVYFTFMLVCAVLFVSRFRHLMYLLSYCHFNSLYEVFLCWTHYRYMYIYCTAAEVLLN